MHFSYIFRIFAPEMARKLDKTTGVVLSSLPLNDHHWLTHLYTREYGKITCSISQKQRLMVSPMTVLSLELSSSGRHSSTGEVIYSIREISILRSSYMEVQSNPLLAARFMFMGEVIDRTVRESEPNAAIWQLVNTDNYDLLQFLLRTLSVLGFHIDDSTYATGCCFDMQEGLFTLNAISHPYYLLPDSATWLHRILVSDETPPMTTAEHDTMLQILITFLKLHVPEMGTIKSLNAIIIDN